MCNFRNTADKTVNCTHCVFFTYWQDEYDDELEPSEYGRCHVVGVDKDETFGEDSVCDYFESCLA